MEDNRNEELWSVAALEYIPERVFDLFSYSTCINKSQELRLNVLNATNLSQHSFSFFQVTTLNETVWGVHHHESPQGQKHRWQASQTQR